MIRRRTRRDVPPDPSTPVDPPTIEQPVVPPAPVGLEAEPSAQVLDELLTFFGLRHGHDGESTSAATRVLAPGEVAAAPPTAPPPAEPPPPESPSPGPAPVGDDLVAAPTRRSARRSVREARREDKRAAKRLARHARQQAGEQAEAAPAAPAPPPPGPASPPAREVSPPSASPPASAGPAAPVDEPRQTVTIVDRDDLPDAVYLEGQLEPPGRHDPADQGERATVFIDDRDPVTGLVTSLEAASAPAVGRIEPRLRDRRIAVKRAVGRRRLKWMALGLAVVGLVVGGLAVAGSGLFEIRSIRVEGVVYSGGAALDAVLDDLEGTNVLRADTEEFERRLEAIPWVADARVSTSLPNRAAVEILEREPVIAYAGADGGFRVLDHRGRVLAITAGQPVAYLLLDVAAGEGPNLQPGAFAPVGFRAAATLVPALGPTLRRQVESIASAPDGSDLRLRLDSGIEVRFGAAANLVDKLVRLQTALTDTDPEHLPTTMIDVSTSDIVVN